MYMISGLEAILIGTKDAKKLAQFYRETLGLKQTMEMEMGDKGEVGFSFDLGGAVGLYIMDHSKVNGKNELPDRIMFNLEVDDIEEEFARLKKSGVKVIQGIYHIQDYGQVATLADTDGNYFQLVQTKPTRTVN